MKIFTVGIFVLLVLFAISQAWAQNEVNDIELYSYDVVKTLGDVEIRSYEEANFIYTTMSQDSYSQTSGKGFNILAGYIFGGNESEQKFAMTSPVEMEMNDQVTMKFLVPSKYNMEDLPKPDSAKVQFKTEKARTMAAIAFGGFADEEKIERYRKALFQKLKSQNIAHTGQWSFMGYDPPFKLFNRKNEVVVELK